MIVSVSVSVTVCVCVCVCVDLVEVDALVVVTAVVVAAVLGPVLFTDVLGRHQRLARVLVLHRQDLSPVVEALRGVGLRV